jgi:hypothetical protein
MSLCKTTIKKIKNKYSHLKIGIKKAEVFGNESEYHFVIKFEGKKTIEVISKSSIGDTCAYIEQEVFIAPFGKCIYEQPEGGPTSFKTKFSIKQKSLDEFFNDMKDVKAFLDIMAEFDRMGRYEDTDPACLFLIDRLLDDKEYYPTCEKKQE